MAARMAATGRLKKGRMLHRHYRGAWRAQHLGGQADHQDAERDHDDVGQDEYDVERIHG
jgi:hypothetical protein